MGPGSPAAAPEPMGPSGVPSPMRILALAAALALAPKLVVSQVTIVDEGSFTVTRGGRAGREDFRIVRTTGATGPVLVASGTAILGSGRTTTALRTDTAGVPIAYQLEEREAGQVRERVNVQQARGRISSRAQSPRGESAREYFMKPGMLVFDEDAVHLYFFVLMHPDRAAVTIVRPRTNVVGELRVSSRGEEPLEIAGASVTARHFVLSDASGSRDVWVDARGRVLRVDAPAVGMTALRDVIPGG